jgi:glycosyltransferase involved in cell wall biosynthesis
LRQVAFAIPGDLNLPTGGYAYDRELLRRLSAHGFAVIHLELPGSFPAPDDAAFARTGQLVLSQPPDTLLLIDGLAYGAFTPGMAAGLAGRVVALVHHPLALETGLTPARASELATNERLVLGYAAHVIATSEATKATLVADYALDAAQVTVAVPGVTRRMRSTGSQGNAPLQLLAVGSIVPRKGHDVLVDALATIASLDWHLTIAGATHLSPETAMALRRQIAGHGLGGRITLAGAVDDASLAGLYAAADVFVMASHYEGYGMVVTEALSHGLPLVSTTGGALGETVPDNAALKVAPGDSAALAKAMGRIICEPALRQSLADAAWALAPTLPDWNETAEIVATVLKSIEH